MGHRPYHPRVLVCFDSGTLSTSLYHVDLKLRFEVTVGHLSLLKVGVLNRLEIISWIINGKQFTYLDFCNMHLHLKALLNGFYKFVNKTSFWLLANLWTYQCLGSSLRLVSFQGAYQLGGCIGVTAARINPGPTGDSTNFHCDHWENSISSTTICYQCITFRFASYWQEVLYSDSQAHSDDAWRN